MQPNAQKIRQSSPYIAVEFIASLSTFSLSVTTQDSIVISVPPHANEPHLGKGVQSPTVREKRLTDMEIA
jgi:hypothetical protein